MFGTFVWANFARSLTLEIVRSLVKLLYVNFICCQIEFIKAEIQLLKYTIFGGKNRPCSQNRDLRALFRWRGFKTRQQPVLCRLS